MIEVSTKPKFDSIALSELHIDRVSQPGMQLTAKFVLLHKGTVYCWTKLEGNSLKNKQIDEALKSLLDCLEKKAADILYENEYGKETDNDYGPKGLVEQAEEADQI
jgi:hypothetical protein